MTRWQVVFCLIEDYTKHAKDAPKRVLPPNLSFAFNSVYYSCSRVEFEFSDRLEAQVYFGRRVAVGRRDWIEQYTLKKREYLGTTSMDSELSLLIANQAQVLLDSQAEPIPITEHFGF
jgi:tRNA (guanine10-N2)-methyltransferase